MTGEEAARCMVELTAAYPSVRLPKETVAVWRSWLVAMPYRETKRAVALVCAREDFPTIHQVIASCGISSEPVLAILAAAKESWEDGRSGFGLVRDPQSPHGWRSSRDALPEPPRAGTPCPPDVASEIRRRISRMVDDKRVPTVRAPTATAKS